MPDDDLLDLPDIETRLERRVTDLIGPDTTPLELVADLDVASLANLPPGGDDYRSDIPLTPFVRTYLFHEITGTPIDRFVDRLEAEPETAAAIGFEDVPHQSTFSRAKTDRFAPDNAGRDLSACIEHAGEHILELAHERGNPMGLRALEPEDKRDVSQSTQHRHKTNTRNEAAENAAEMLASVITFDRAENTTYDIETFLRVLAFEAVTEGLSFGDFLGGLLIRFPPHQNSERGLIHRFRIAEVVQIVLDQVETGEVEVASRDADLLALGDDLAVRVFESSVRIIDEWVETEHQIPDNCMQVC